MYERREWWEGEVRWGLADRRAYKEGRLRARANVRLRLSQTLKPGATTAGTTGDTWADVAKKAVAPLKAEDGLISLEDIEAYTARRSVVMGLRVGSVPGMPHDRAHDRRVRVEKDSGKEGPATRQQAWGCPLCREAVLKRQAGRNMGRGARRDATRMRQQLADDYEEEAAIMRDTRCSTRHLLCGACLGNTKEERKALRASVINLHSAVKKVNERAKSGGEILQEVLDKARYAVLAEEADVVADDEQWEALGQVLAAELPDLKGEAKIKMDKSKDSRDTVHGSMLSAQCAATTALGTAQNKIDRMKRLMAGREEHREKMKVTFMAWREEVEHSQRGVRAQPHRWRIRQRDDHERAPQSRAALRIPIARSERIVFLEEQANKAKNGGVIDKEEKPKPQPGEAAPSPLQKAKAVLTCLRVYRGARAHEPQPPDRPVQVTTVTGTGGQQVQTATGRVDATGRASRSKEGGPRQEYNEKREYLKKAREAVAKAKGIRRKRRTTHAAVVGVELQRWMREVGERELRKRRGVG